VGNQVKELVNVEDDVRSRLSSVLDQLEGTTTASHPVSTLSYFVFCETYITCTHSQTDFVVNLTVAIY